MTIQNLKKTVLFSIFTLMVFTSCNSNDEDDNVKEPEPIVLENYYFKGTLDGQELNIEFKIYDFYSSNTLYPYYIDFGGSRTNDYKSKEKPSTGFCYGRYACGLSYTDKDNPDKLDAAKMYFSRIPIGDCNLESELFSMRASLEDDNYKYRIFYENFPIRTVALDFFPGDVENEEIYYSSRFGDNTDATFKITSVNEVENGWLEVEGKFNCKLYKHNDETVFKKLENGEFKIKISTNLKR